MGSQSVAIIKSDASARCALGRLLRAAGFEPTGFDSAESFLADQRPSPFGCLLVDMQLRGISGLELQRQLLAEGSRIPVIFITADNDPATRSVAIQRGCVDLFRYSDPGALLIDAFRRATAQTGDAESTNRANPSTGT